MDSFFFRHKDLPYIESRYAENSSAYYGLHSHPTVSIGLIISGRSIIEVNDREYQIESGDIVMFNPDQPHACNPFSGTEWSYHMLYFDLRWWKEIMNISSDQNYRPFQHPILKDAKLCDDLCHINSQFFAATATSNFVEIEINLLKWINQFISTLEPSEAIQDNDAPNWIIEVQEYLINNSEKTIKLEELCLISKIPITQLIRKFKHYCGLTPYAYLQNYRINQARKLLSDGNSISDVAYQLGFADQSHLHRLFKRLVASTPKCYQYSASQDV